LYLRSHRAAVSITAATVIIAAIWALTAGFTSEPAADPRLVLLAVTVAVAALATTLDTADDALDRSAALPWPPRRAAHLLAICAITVGLLALTMLTTTRFGTLTFIARDTAGLTGLLGLSATVLGTHRAWIPVLGWFLGVMVIGDPSGRNPVLTWMMQPTDVAAATITAVVLGVCGAAGYALIGPPRRPASDTGS
jgi:hypothetical protein